MTSPLLQDLKPDCGRFRGAKLYLQGARNFSYMH